MRIGVYLQDFKPNAGGASSLIETIRKELMSLKSEYEFVILYKGLYKDSYKEKHGKTVYINISAAKKKYFLKIKARKLKFKGININNFFSDRTSYHLAESFWDEMCRREQIDLLWFPEPVFERTSVPYIWTLWDLGHRNLPALPEMCRNGEWERREARCKEMLYRASYVITGNETGKKEILENYNISDNKIRIVPFPITSYSRGEEIKPSINLDKPYFFYPAQLWPHKNHIRIIEAMGILKRRGVDCRFVFTGSDKGIRDYLEARVKDLSIEDNIIFAGFVSNEEMNYLYNHAEALVFASLLGPNNLPPIEACYHDCPVIISDIPGHREQMSGAAIYFNPLSAEDLADKMEQILDKEDEIKAELKVGRESVLNRLNEYSYSEEMMKVFDEFARLRKTWGE